MTQLTKDMIPPSIVTVEALAVWCEEILQHLYPDLEVIEAKEEDNTPIKLRVVDSNKFYLTGAEVAHWRHIGRVSVKLRPEHQVSGRLWEHVEILGDKPIPTGMKAA